MAQQDSDSLTRFSERYANGKVPWDDLLPPPEVQALAAPLPAGRALDLGCGYGRTAIYLAKLGWQVVGIDFVPAAIEEAKRRAEASGVADKIKFETGSVADMAFVNGRFDLAVDIGCLHSLTPELQQNYCQELLLLLKPKAPYLLFARLHNPEDAPADGPSGLAESELKALLADMSLQKQELGITQGDDYCWQSGWFYYLR